MRGKPGILVETDKKEIGVAYHKEQAPEFKAKGKIFIHILDRESFEPVIDAKTGLARKTLIDVGRCKAIGMFD